MELFEAKLNQLTSVVESSVQSVEKMVRSVGEVVTAFAKRASQQGMWIPITSFDPEPYKLMEHLTAVVTPSGEDFEAALYDINVYASGDNEEEAVSNLRSYLLDLFDHYSECPDDTLGPEPLKQKRFLVSRIERT